MTPSPRRNLFCSQPTSTPGLAIRIARLVFVLALSGFFPCLVPPLSAIAQSPRPTSDFSAPTPPMPKEKLKEKLDTILNGSEFKPDAPDKNSVNHRVKKIIEDIRKRWNGFLKWLGDLFKTGAMVGGGNAVTGIVVTLLIAFLAWIVFRLSRDWSSNRHGGHLFKNVLNSMEEAQADIVRDPLVWFEQAEEWARKKDYRRAYRALFLAILLRLDAARVLSYDRARANGDYLLQLRAKELPNLYDVLAPLAASYDRFWYGRSTAQAADYGQITEVYRALPRLLQQGDNASTSLSFNGLSGSTAEPSGRPGKASM